MKPPGFPYTGVPSERAQQIKSLPPGQTGAVRIAVLATCKVPFGHQKIWCNLRSPATGMIHCSRHWQLPSVRPGQGLTWQPQTLAGSFGQGQLPAHPWIATPPQRFSQTLLSRQMQPVSPQEPEHRPLMAPWMAIGKEKRKEAARIFMAGDVPESIARSAFVQV